MSIQALREFINRHNTYATGLAALGAALDAKASGTPLEPAIGARVEELLAALGAGDMLSGVSAEEATPLVPEIRHQLRLNSKLLYAETRSTCWSYPDPQLLSEIGEFSRAHANAITRMAVPALDGLSQRFEAPGAAFLDIGVGVAGTAVALAQQWPALRIVGIDVWQPSLALARENVEKANLGERIELREQGAETLVDDQVFDLAWMPIPFIPERVIPASAERTLRALRSGGWVILPFANLEGMDAASTAFWRLRLATWGGPQWATSDVEKVLRDAGFVEVRTLPRPPGGPVSLTVGRRSPG